MYKSSKIATCCYCGTRAALVLGQDRHELVCSGCGAPLHDLKSLRADHPLDYGRVKPSKMRGTLHSDPPKKKSKSKKKKKKSFGQRLFSEALDLLDDVFD